MLTDADVQRLNDQACTNNFGRQGEWDELNEDGKAWALELARLAHEQGCRDVVACASEAAGRLAKLLPDVPPGVLYSEAAANEIERLRAALLAEQASHDMTKAAFEAFVETPPEPWTPALRSKVRFKKGLAREPRLPMTVRGTDGQDNTALIESPNGCVWYSVHGLEPYVEAPPVLTDDDARGMALAGDRVPLAPRCRQLSLSGGRCIREHNHDGPHQDDG